MIPSVNITVKNGGLGLAAASSEGIQAIVGRIAAAELTGIDTPVAIDTPTQFANPSAVTAACGNGPVAQAAVLALQEGGGPVVICRSADGEQAFQTAVLASVDALQASTSNFEQVHIVCDAGHLLSASEASELSAALELKAKAFWSAHRYDSAFFAIEMEDLASSASVPNVTKSDFIAVCQGTVNAVNPISGASQKNPLAWHACARCSAVGLGRDLAATMDGPLSGVISVDHDEASHGGACDTAGLTTARTFPRRAGVYLTNPRINSASGSDFKLWQHRRVMNAACAAADDYLFTLLSSSVRVDASTGHIDESAAKAIEANCEAAVKARVGEWISDVSVTVDRSANILSTGDIPVHVAIVPLGYVKAISVEIGFRNPAIAEAQG